MLSGIFVSRWAAGVVAGAVCAIAIILASPSARADAAPAQVQHPFILWNRDDLVAMKKKIDTQDWAKKEYARMTASRADNDPLVDLFSYAVMGDEKAGQHEKMILLKLLAAPDPLGGAEEINILRYDLLYDLLSPKERTDIEAMFRHYMDYSLFTDGVYDPKLFNDNPDPKLKYSRYDAHVYTRTNWLPNIIFPRKISANLMAVALRDEALIHRAYEANGSLKYFFDDWLGDQGFYEEEFSKFGSLPGAAMLWCNGLQRLGISEMGFDYTGKGGATMRGWLYSVIRLGYPRIDLGTSRPQYATITFGDLRQSPPLFPRYAFQQFIASGYLRDGTGGNSNWILHGAWGGTTRGNSNQWDNDKTPKMQIPLLFEWAQAKWPQDGFDYFLAQMRAPDQDHYFPSLYFGLDPIDPAAAEKHAPPAPSYIAKDRGFAFLHAVETPDYWASPAPAVSMRLAAGYAHRVNDEFAITGFVAFNRPLYINRHINNSYAAGWTRSIQSHAGLMVDGIEPIPSDSVASESSFGAEAKMIIAHDPGKVYAGIDLTRMLALTPHYLVDASRLTADQPHVYRWLVHALGQATVGSLAGFGEAPELAADLPELKNLRFKPQSEEPPLATIIQGCPIADPGATKLGSAWYDRKIGVRIQMLSAPGSEVAIADTPQAFDAKIDETGGTSVVVTRRGKTALYVALHEPVQGGKSTLATIRAIARQDDAVVLAVDSADPGNPFADRILIDLSGAARPCTLSGSGESFTFTTMAFVHVTEKDVVIEGKLSSLSMKVLGSPSVRLNGKVAGATVNDGVLTVTP